MGLDTRVALVTGGAGGIGAAISEVLAANGARVAVADLNEERAKATAADLASATRAQVIGVQIDVTSTKSIHDAVAGVTSELGPPGILVNNAGIDRIQPFTESTEETWDLLIATNLKGTIACSRAVLDGMIEREFGRIVNIASDAGKVGSSGEVVYSATKGGVISFTKALAREVARSNITVNCVCPGPTDTPLLGQVADANPKLRAALERSIPLRRIAQPSDVAPMVGFLVDEGGAYMTGQAISVSGGLTMS